MSYKSNISEAKRRMRRARTRTLTAIGVFVSGETQVRTSVDQGNLKNSYTYRVDEEKGRVDIGTPVDYAPFVEKGTGVYNVDGEGRQTPWVYRRHDGSFVTTIGNQAQPHLTPAAEENVDRIKKLAQSEYAKGMADGG